MRPEWIYSRGFYFWSKAEGEVRIFGFYNNKKTNKKTNLAYKAFHPIFFDETNQLFSSNPNLMLKPAPALGHWPRGCVKQRSFAVRETRLSAGTCWPEDTCQPTNVVDCFYDKRDPL